jgi:hypothetical protein
MLSTYQGYIENGGFVLSEPIKKLPERKRAILTILNEERLDDGSLSYLFRDYVDDRIREPLIDFGEAVGNEKW